MKEMLNNKNKLILPIKMHRTPTLEPNVPRSLMGTYTPADRDQSQGWEKHRCLEQQSAWLRNLLPGWQHLTGKDGTARVTVTARAVLLAAKEKTSLSLSFCIYSSVYFVLVEVRAQLLSGLCDNHLYPQAITGPKIFLSAFLEFFKQTKPPNHSIFKHRSYLRYKTCKIY